MLKRFFQSSALFWIALTLLSLAGGYVIFYGTAVGPWAFSDSTTYITAGLNWINGNGMGFYQADGRFAALAHFPPGYPMLIGLVSLLFPDPITAIRWINIVCFFLLILLGGLLLNKITFSRLVPLLYGVLLVFSPFLITPFSGAMSEAPAILAGTLAILLLVRFRQTDNKVTLLAAGLLSCAALFIRYQQAALLLSGGIFLLFLTRRNWKSWLKDTLLYALASAGPFILWLVLNAVSFPHNEPRDLALHRNVLEVSQLFLSNTYNTVKYWFPWRTGLFPVVDAPIVRYLLAALYVFMLGFGFLRWRKTGNKSSGANPVWQLTLLSLVYIAADLLFLWAAMLLARPAPDVDNRMLSPLLPVLFVFVLCSFLLTAVTFKRQWPFRLMMIVVTSLFCITFASQERDYLVEMHYGGEGYTSTTFKDSRFVETIRALNKQTTLITNSPALVQFFTLKEPYRTFEKKNDPVIAATSRYGEGSSPQQRLFREECAALVVFDPDLASRYNPDSASYFPPEARGVTEGLVIVYSDELGTIYAYPGCNLTP